MNKSVMMVTMALLWWAPTAVQASSCQCTCCSSRYCTAHNIGSASTMSCSDCKMECASTFSTCSSPCTGGNGVCSTSCSSSSGGGSGASSDGINWDKFSFDSVPTFFMVSTGLLGLVLGFPLGLAGYKLWKYTIFLLGFLIMGVSAFAVAFLISVLNMDTTDATEFADTGHLPTHVWVASGLSGFGVGVLGGFCFLGIYLCVIFCLGCGFGMSMFWYIIAIVIASNLSVSAGTAQAATDVHAVGTTVYVLMAIDLIIGIVCGVLFVKFQKWAIMLGTAAIGSNWIWIGILQMFAHLDPSWWQTVLVYATTAAFFVVQWKYTSVGTEIDPKTGKVTVIIVNQPGGLTQPIFTSPPSLAAPQQLQYASQPQYVQQPPNQAAAVPYMAGPQPPVLAQAVTQAIPAQENKVVF
jgi:hypothetical protein